jgi:uncharacterized protein YndB with AHSA1/START domain
MTKDKAEKAAIRSRMAKTGERYTTARHYLLDHHRTAEDDHEAVAADDQLVPEPPTEPQVPPWAANPGMSDEAIRRGTGKRWDEWFAVLDAWGGTDQTHTEIARYVHDEYAVDGWWAQGVAVGYERARGMRVRHQQPDGFSVSASKTFPAPVERVFATFVEDGLRDGWIEPGSLRVRTAQPHRSARFDVLLPGAIGTRIEVYFTAKGETKASAAIQHSKLPDAESIEPWRAFWKELLARLARYLQQG